MKKEKKLESLKNRLEDVFLDDLEAHAWHFKIVEGVEDEKHQLREISFILCDLEESLELTITISVQTSIPVMKLTLKSNTGKEELGTNTEMAMMERDKEKLKAINEEIMNQIDEELKPIIRRIYQYISVKIDEFLY